MSRKYAKYFIEYDPKEWPPPPPLAKGEKDTRPTIAQVDNHIAKGSFFYRIHWMLPGGEVKGLGHAPHIHKEAELLFHIGSNPEDPTDLGAEFEMHFGEEMERYTFNKSMCIFIPPMMVHCPWKPLKIYKPLIMIQVNQAVDKTEKFTLDILPKALRDQVDMSMIKDTGF